nr:HAMP domain-containing sensor histidine kinase [uncultured Faecalicatena sp.]
MDWLEEKVSCIAKKIRSLSFRSAITAYILVIALAGILLSYMTITICYRYQSIIWNRYNAEDSMWLFSADLENWPFWAISFTGFQRDDRTVMIILDMLLVCCPFFYGVAGSVLACFLFYKKRLKAPLDILKRGTEQVSQNNLDFDLTYDSQDEMGALCNSFERMRMELIHNNEEMWKLVENQKQLNAAFAHDLRTPLTVLKGYSDFLARYLPLGRLSEEKMLDTLNLMSEHLSRLEQYSRTMKGIRSLDELPVLREPLMVGSIWGEIKEVVFALNQIGDVEILLDNVSIETAETEAYADRNLILEVLENLLSNAIRFAKSRIEVFLSLENSSQMLYLTVRDNGAGFTDYDLQKAVLPYYKEHSSQEKQKKTAVEKVSDNPHFGIGLHICRQLCLKHGGELSIANSMVGGAIVTASFSCKND